MLYQYEKVDSFEESYRLNGLRNIDFEKRYLYPYVVGDRKQYSPCKHQLYEESSGGGTHMGTRFNEELESQKG